MNVYGNVLKKHGSLKDYFIYFYYIILYCVIFIFIILYYILLYLFLLYYIYFVLFSRLIFTFRFALQESEKNLNKMEINENR